jgi:hypothetical protein
MILRCLGKCGIVKVVGNGGNLPSSEQQIKYSHLPLNVSNLFLKTRRSVLKH